MTAPTPTEADIRAARAFGDAVFGDLSAWRDEDQPRVREIREAVVGRLIIAFGEHARAARDEEREQVAAIADREANACDHHAQALRGSGRVPVSTMHSAAAGVCRSIARQARALAGTAAGKDKPDAS